MNLLFYTATQAKQSLLVSDQKLRDSQEMKNMREIFNRAKDRAEEVLAQKQKGQTNEQ